jgi:hypothetical protein
MKDRRIAAPAHQDILITTRQLSVDVAKELLQLSIECPIFLETLLTSLWINMVTH